MTEIPFLAPHFGGFEVYTRTGAAGFRNLFKSFMRLALVVAAGVAFQLPAGELNFERDIQPLLKSYCYSCHGPNKPKGGINLAAFTSEQSVLKDLKQWETVLRCLRENEMPPENKPQPKMAEKEKLLGWLQHLLDNISEGKIARDPGRVLIHRLSNLEYNNTIRDLFGVDSRPADKFPADGSGGAGFDNNADTLFIPPILLEKYLSAAEQILDEAKPERIFIKRGDNPKANAKAARDILKHYAPLIFRRPVEDPELERFAALYDKAAERGYAAQAARAKDKKIEKTAKGEARDPVFEDAVKTMLKALLVSPNFLYRAQSDQPLKEPYLISENELANRLSYFLWSSMPDEELFKQVKKKKLRDPKVLDQQIKRMLLDPKAKAFAENFVTQWLGVRALKTAHTPDARKFPTYTPSLRDAMYDETVEFFHALLKDDASLLHLIDCDYTYVNEELAKHYGISGVQGTELRRVTLADRNRGGVLGMGAVLTLSSYPQRTSPVLRGKWVLEEILGASPPPPPQNVGLLPPDDSPKDGKTFRERLELHRQKAECAACHNKLDPLGFGLENFDPIGRWRDKIVDRPVDASGVLTTGEKFNGPKELKPLLLKQKDEFLRTLTEKMLSYGLGRGLEFYDVPTVRQIAAAVAKNEYRSNTLIVEVIKSFPFQYRRNEPIAEAVKK